MKKIIYILCVISLISCEDIIRPLHKNTGETSVTGNVTDLTPMSATITSWANFSLYSIGDNEIGILIGRSKDLEQDYEDKYYSNSIAKDNSYSIKVKGLVPDAEYYFCSFVRQNGIYEYGNVKSFKTPKADFKISVDIDYIDAGSCRGTIRYDLGNVRYDSFEVKIDCPNTIVRGGVTETSHNSAKFSFVNIPYKRENVLMPYLVIDGQRFYGEDVKVQTKDFSYNGVKVEASFEHYKIKLHFESSLAKSDNIKYGIMHCTIGDNNTLVSYIDESEGRNGNILEGSFLPMVDGLTDDAFKVGLYLSSISYFEERIRSGSDTREDDEAYEKLKGLVKDYLEKIVDKHYYAVAFVENDGIYYKIGYYSIEESHRLGYPSIYKAEDNPIDPNAVNYDEYVDLGLSVYWASCNLGATKPEEYGDYYAWGEVETYYRDGDARSTNPSWKTGKSSGYTWDSYKWCYGADHALSKYCSYAQYGKLDHKETLESNDDVAHIKLGGKYRIPTIDEFEELVNNSNAKWTTVNGVNGVKFTSKKNYNSIFLPAAGERSGLKIMYNGSNGHYWSSSLDYLKPRNACYLHVNYGGAAHEDRASARFLGFSVRPVLEK